MFVDEPAVISSGPSGGFDHYPLELLLDGWRSPTGYEPGLPMLHDMYCRYNNIINPKPQTIIKIMKTKIQVKQGKTKENTETGLTSKRER